MKRTFAALALTLVCAAPFVSSALTAEEVQAQIQALLRQLTMLQEQLRQLGGGSTSPANPPPATLPGERCYRVDRPLFQGVRGDDVRALQDELRAQGFFNEQTTGYFGPVTEAAVRRFQETRGIVSGGTPATTGYGMVGPQTSRSIWVCGGGQANQPLRAVPTRGEAPLEVAFYTNFGKLRSSSPVLEYGDGTSERVAECYAPTDFCESPGKNVHTYTQDGTYTAKLIKIDDLCSTSDPNTNVVCAAPVSQAVLGSVTITVGGIIACPMIAYQKPICAEGEVAVEQKNGQCPGPWVCQPTTPPAQCRVWDDGCNTCTRTSPGGLMACTLRYCFAPGKAYCREYFGGGTNQPPIISGFSGPTILTTGQTGTWQVSASDPENQTLSYHINWGDQISAAPPEALSANGGAFVQQTTFTHSYASPGTYTITVTVRDALGQSARTTSTVQVTGGTHNLNFSASPTTGNAPLSVIFSASGGDEEAFLVDFGDGSSSNVMYVSGDGSTRTVSHVYQKPGTYTAVLSKKHVCNSIPGLSCSALYSSDVARLQITVSESTSAADFSASPTSGGTPLTVTFKAKGFNDSWMEGNQVVAIADRGHRYIEFGDGSSAKVTCPQPAYSSTCMTTITHTYQNAGTYFASYFTAGYYGIPNDSVYGTRQNISTIEIRASDATVCTADAHQCPDGSWVGRTGPSCTFQCPATGGGQCPVGYGICGAGVYGTSCTLLDNGYCPAGLF